MLPLILSNCEKILHTGNVTTYQQALFPDGHSVASKIYCRKKEIEKTALRRNIFFYYH